MAADAETLREQAKRIRELRAAKERRDGEAISQETAAYEIGVSSRTYRTWEGVGADLKIKNLKALAAYYDTTTEYILRGAVEKGPTPDVLGALSSDARLARIEAKLEQILSDDPDSISSRLATVADQVAQLRAGQVVHDAAARSQSATTAGTTRRSRQQQP